MKKVLYVPLDDRPANLDDVIVQGKAAGLHIVTPNQKDIRNRLDSEKTVDGTTLLGTSTPQYGKPSNIHDFILAHAAEVEGFIISSDMLAYGGLIGSRELRENGGGDYPNYDQETTRLLDVIRVIKEKYPCKPVYVMDTIMRLATTSFADGLALDAYNESRALMQQPRQTFTTFEDIIQGITYLLNLQSMVKRPILIKNNTIIRDSINSKRICISSINWHVRDTLIFSLLVWTMPIRKGYRLMKSVMWRIELMNGLAG